MKIKVKNFQIFEGESELEFQEGINVVVGPNASGKTSIFYAIEDLLLNPSGVDDCINWNHPQTEVTLENKNNNVTWIRSSGSSTYIDNINNQKYVKASKLDSRDIADLGFYFDNKNRVVNIHDEWSVLFPFGESDSDMFRLFEDIFNISCSFHIIDEMKKDENGIKSSINTCQLEKSSLENKLNQINVIKEKVQPEEITYHINKIKESDQLASCLREDCEKFSKSMLYRNIVLPKVYDVSKLYKACHEYENLTTDYNSYCKFKEKAKLKIPKIDNPITIDSPKSIQQDYQKYCESLGNILECRNQIKILQQTKVELESKLKEINVCPTCGRVLEEDLC